MVRNLRVGWRWLRRQLYRATRQAEQALGDNHPWFPCDRASTLLKAAKAASR